VDPWVEDLKFHFAGALRAVGIGLAAVAWASALSSEAQQNADVRSAAQVAAAIVGVCISQWFTRLPPSATGVELLRPFERDIRAVAREQAPGNPRRREVLVARIGSLAAVRLRGGARVGAHDRRDWVRALGRLADHADPGPD
jgi:hypothetical protein